MNSLKIIDEKRHFSTKVQAQTSKLWIFCEFICPHCKQKNIIAKKDLQKIRLCSNNGCKRNLIIDKIVES